jgi:hypothetical protein
MILPYSYEKFVGREWEMADVQNNWIQDHRSDVLVILGPPRTGKSWFVGRLSDLLCQLNHPLVIPPVFQLDIKELIVENPGQIGQCTVSNEKYTEWVKGFIAANQPIIPTLSAYNPNMELQTSVEVLAEELTRHFGDEPIYLIIDDGDLLTEKFWRDFEKKIVEPFHSVPDSRFRFVIALRDDLIKLPGLKRRRLHIEPWRGDEGDRQLALLLWGHNRWTVRRLKSKLPGYDWRHPGLNWYLYDQYVVNYDQQVNRQILLKDGLQKILHATSAANPLSEIQDWLLTLVQTERDWTQSDLEELWENETSEEVIRRSDILLNNWLFIAAGDNNSRWRLPPGVASYVRACL